MPPPSSRMTKQPAKPVRYFPGKAYAEDPESEEESEEDEDEEEQEQGRPAAKAPPPKVTSFSKKPAGDRSIPSALPEKDDDLEGFETASESSEDAGGKGDSSEEEESSEEDDEDSSSDDEPKRPMLAPKFISKAKRAQQQSSNAAVSAEQKAAEEERKRKEKADELLQAQIEKDAAARKAGKKYWDDDDIVEGEVDDTDDVGPEAEKAAWKLRELKRVQRDRQALIAKEKEREEIERRRNLTTEKREAEDREFLEKQAVEREGKGKMAFMQKYHHKGAFFRSEDQDEDVKAALNRDIAGRKFVDDTGDKSVLPEYMRIRDMTRLGKKGRTKYQDMRNEDTGRWGQFENKKRLYDGLDDRFRPDERGGGDKERTGGNAVPVGERRRLEDEAGREEKRPKYD